MLRWTTILCFAQIVIIKPQSFCTRLTYGRKKLYIHDVQSDQQQEDFVHGRCTGCTSVLHKLHSGSGHFVQAVRTKCFKTMHRFLERFYEAESRGHACMGFAEARKRSNKIQRFYEAESRGHTCMGFAEARKRSDEIQHFSVCPERIFLSFFIIFILFLIVKNLVFAIYLSPVILSVTL